MDEPIMSPAEAKRSYHRALIRKKLEEKGVEQVQAELVDNAGFNPFQLEAMREWLLEKRANAAADEHAKVAEREQREIDREIAREANDIARVANSRADRANVIAIAALVVSLLTAGAAALFT